MYTALFRSHGTVHHRIDIVALALRLSLAVIFLYHGLDKITSDVGGGAWASRMYDSAGTIQVPGTLTYSAIQFAVAWGEILCGLAMLAGLLTRVAALGLIVIQIGAICLVTYPRGFRFAQGGGYEYNLALLAMCLSLLILGAGVWSVDWLLVYEHMKAAGHPAAASPTLVGPHTMPAQSAEAIVSAQGANAPRSEIAPPRTM